MMKTIGATAIMMLVTGCGRVNRLAEAEEPAQKPATAKTNVAEGSRPTAPAKPATAHWWAKKDNKVEPVIEPKVQPWLMTSVDLSEIYTNPVRGRLWDKTPVTMLATVTKIHPSYLSCLGAPGRPIGDIRVYWADATGFDRLAEWDRILIKGEIEGRGVGATVVRKAVLLDREIADAANERLLPRFRGELAQSGEYRVYNGQHSP